jgi:hypothetical protein
LATEPHILAACLYDSRGRVFAEYRSPAAPRNLALPAWRSDGSYFDRESLTLFRGVLLNGERTGSIALVFDLRDFRSRLLEYSKIAILVVLVSILATFLVASRLAHTIAAFLFSRVYLHIDDPSFSNVPSRLTCACRWIKRRTIS